MRHPLSARQIAIVGHGRVGSALAEGLREAGYRVVGPLSRSYSAAELDGIELALLCVPDREIAGAAGVLAQRRRSRALESDTAVVVGHCSGATPLDVLVPFPERFSLHPLMTFASAHGADRGDAGLRSPQLRGASAAIAGSSPRALGVARELALALGLRPFVVREEDRAAYHAAASMACNFLIALEAAAERLAGSAGCERAALVPLVRQTVENWALEGSDALTGPIARGDDATVARQREAVATRTPELLHLFDALAQTTRELAEVERTRALAAQTPRAERAAA